jgi:neutral ceramidase
MSAHPLIDMRWTRVCFCGQQTSAGRLDDRAVYGRSYLTGSEEGRGPLFDITGEIYEGQPSPVAVEPQGNKVQARRDVDGTQSPTVVPITTVRLGDRLLVTVPGEMTAEMGRRTRAAAATASAGTGVRQVVIAGYANEYASYFTTPEEYAEQHYEGGVTVYGPASGPFLAESLADLSGRLARGDAAPDPVPFDPTRGLEPDAPAYPPGAAEGKATEQPTDSGRLGHVTFSWRGGGSGTDRPLDRPFVTIQRSGHPFDTDLGLNLLWRVDDDRPQNQGKPRFEADDKGTYTATWEPPYTTPTGSYRFVITARRYRLVSRSFRLGPARNLTVASEGTAGTTFVRLVYPPVRENEDLTFRPAHASNGTVTARVGAKAVKVRIVRGVARIPTQGQSLSKIQARDRYGNSAKG